MASLSFPPPTKNTKKVKMSLEAALEEERRLSVAQIGQDVRGSSATRKSISHAPGSYLLSPGSPRGRSPSPGYNRILTPVMSNKSRSPGRILNLNDMSAEDAELMRHSSVAVGRRGSEASPASAARWSITRRDPSSRIKSIVSTFPERNAPITPDSEEVAVSTDDEDEDSEESEEEVIYDTDSDTEYEGIGVNPAPNFLSIEEQKELSRSHASTSKPVHKSMLDPTVLNAKPDSSPNGYRVVNVSSDAYHTSLIDVAGEKKKLHEYSNYKQKLVSPNSEVSKGFSAPYTSSSEKKKDEEISAKLNETITISPIESNEENCRIIRTITRGNCFEIMAENAAKNKPPKTILECIDFSEESIFALEWCFGTALVDGSVLYLVYAIDDGSNKSTNHQPTSKERMKKRVDFTQKLTELVLKYLRRTRLQIHIVLEVMHHPYPKRLIVDLIDGIDPTLVVVGSRGRSTLKGVLMGSFSNYLVSKSSSAVMVVRKKYKKPDHKSKLDSNGKHAKRSLSEARID